MYWMAFATAVGDNVIMKTKHTVYNMVIAWVVFLATTEVFVVVNVVPVDVEFADEVLFV